MMARYKIEVSKECISCGNCAAVCPEFFELGEKAKAKKPETDDLGCAKEAAEQCPVNAIHITDNEKKKRVI